jgi:AraC-like DNA-binding protein
MPAIHGFPDAMSDVLGLVRMRGEMICANEYCAPWSYGFERPIAHFHIVERGAAWMRLAGEPPLRLEVGDLVIVPRGGAHFLSSHPDLPSTPIEAATGAPGARRGSVFRLGSEGGEETHVVCGQFSCDGVLAPRLLSVLPPLIHIQARGGRPLEWLRLTSHFLVEEMRNPRPGSAIMITRLIDLLFVQAIRDWGARHHGSRGWLAGLGDVPIGRALSAIHDEPDRRWTVSALAAIAGLSRSAFAARFGEVVGQTPVKYVSSWRLDLAADHLRAGGDSLSRIAERVGYGSEAALTRAFKKQFGIPPAQFRKAGAGQILRGPRLDAVNGFDPIRGDNGGVGRH